MGIWRIDPRFGLALVLPSAVCVAGTRKAELGQNGGQTQGGQAQTPPQGPPPRPTPSKPPNRPQPGHTALLPSQPGLHQSRAPADFCSWRVHSALPDGAARLAWLSGSAARIFGGVFRRVCGGVRSDLVCDPEPGQPVRLAWQRLSGGRPGNEDHEF